MLEYLKQLLDWIYKRRCYFCGKTSNNGLMCERCFNSLEIYPPEAIRTISNVKIFTIGKYTEILQKLIRAVKYHKKKELIEPFARLMAIQWENIGVKADNYEIVPIPLFVNREKQRGYNHMNLVAIELSKITGLNVNLNLVKRVKDTRPQYKLSQYERKMNLKDAFQVYPEFLTGKNILIIDDICTTGTTIAEMIKELRKYNVKNITALVLAVPN